MKKQFLAGAIVILMLFASVITVGADDASKTKSAKNDVKLAPKAKSAILLERDTGKVIYEKNIGEELPPASMTKIMTLILIMEALESGNLELDEMVRASEQAASMGGTQIFLEAGEEMSVENLLKGIAIGSANDASVALAEHIFGSEAGFVEKMNEKAEALALKHTQFQNVSGLPIDNHYTTAHDLAIMAQELLKYETITEYTSIYDDYLRKDEENEFWLVNTNRLVKFHPNIDGLKTGFTTEAKYGLTATAEKDDMRLIAVVMGAETSKERNKMISNMIDYGFAQYDTTQLFSRGERVTELNLLRAETDTVDVVTSDTISTMHKKGNPPENVITNVKLSDDITLPLSKGDQVGELVVKDEKDVLSTTPLIVNQNLEHASLYTLLKRSMRNLAGNH